MRKLFCVLVILLNVCWVNIALAQNTNPNYGIFFQAVARDNFSNPAKDRVVFVESSILQFTANGTKVLTELHQTTTDGLGVFSINIGSGQRIGGTLSGLDKVDWANGPYFLGLKIAIKPLSPVSNWDYTKELIDLGASSFGTVPYAYYAGNSAGVKDVVKTTDTSAMLLPYAKASALQQTNTNLGLKVNVADSTTIYVTPTQLRAVKFDTTAIYNRLSERELLANKSVNVTTDANSDIKYPSVKAIKSYVDLQFSNFVLADGSVTAAKIADGAVTDAKITSVSGSKVTGDIAGNAATATLATNATNAVNATNATKLATPRTINGVAFDGTANITIATGSTVLDADVTTKGVVQLAGDLTGTAAQPVVAANAITTSKIADGAVTDAKITSVAGSKVTGTVAIANGGTGAATAAGARTNLGLVIGTDVLAQRTFGSAANNNTSDFVATTEKGANNGVATLGNDGKIPSVQIPSVSFQSATVVSSQAAMLALNSAVVGSIAIRTDNNKNYVLSALPASTLVNWIELATPSSVTSVNGFAGPNVVLTAADVNGVEVALNKSSNIINDAQSTTKYPSVKAIKDYVDQQSSNAGVADNSITSNKINGTIAITKGGTGATNAADARTNLGLVIGTDVMSASATTTLTGDVAGSGNGTIATTINSVGGVSSNTISTFDTRIASNTSSITTNTANILLKAPIASPAFTGTPTAPTPATSDNSTKIATTEYVKNSITAANAGISSIGNISGTSNAKGATISGTTELILTPADATNGGILTSGAQTIAGAKTFSNDVTAPNFVGNLTGNAITATTAGNITATSNSTLTTLSNLNTVGTITSGTWSGTTIAIANGGTGATNAADARTNLGLTIGTDVMAANATTTLTGDVTGTGSGTFTTTLANSGVTAGSYGSTTAIPTFTVDAKGRLTNAGTVGITAGVSSLNYTSTTSYATGGTVSGTSLTLAAADGTNPGLISTGAQTIAGAKTFNNSIIIPGASFNNGTAIWEMGGAANSTGLQLIQGGCCARLRIDDNGRFAIGANYSPTTYQFDVQGDARFTQNVTAPNFLGNATSATTATTAGNITATANTTLTSLSNLNTVGTITSGTWSGTTIAVANGGTGATNASDARANLGVIATTEKGANNGVATLGNDGKIPSAQIPSVSFQSATVVANQAAMLALSSAVVGSIAIRTDNNNNYVLSALPGSTLANWIQLATPSSVTSVNGNAGPNVVLTAADISGVELASNKSTSISTDALSTTKYPSVKLIKDYVDQQSANAGVADNSITSSKISGTIEIAKGGTGATTASDARTNLGLTIGTDVMAANATTTLTGDITGTGSGTFTTTLSNSGVTAGSYGSSTAIPTLTVDSKGRITSASTVGITAGVSSLNYTSTTSYAAGGTISGTALTLAAADGTNPGLISTSAQSIAGAKTFSNDVTAPNFIGNATTATTAGNITATSNTTLTSLSNLTTVGTITSGTWGGTTVDVAKGGTGLTSATSGQILFGNGTAALGTNSNLFWDNTNSRLGVGTNTPGNGFNTKLDVVGRASFRTNGANSGLIFDGYSPSGNLQVARIYTEATSGTPSDFVLGTYPNGHGNQLFLKQSNGFVGIRNTSPTSELDVSGTVTATSFSGPLSGNASTASALAAGKTISLTGDVSYTSPSFDGSNNVTAAATLTNTTVTAGSYGSSTAIPTFTVDAKGRLTAASTVGITAGVSSLNYTAATSYAAGGTISGTALTLAAADGTNPGLISTGAQTIAGAKTFSSDITAPNFLGNASTATAAGNITATSNTTLTSLLNLNTIGTITSGTWSGTTIGISNGGTGATTASDARTNLGLGALATKSTISNSDVIANAAIDFSKLSITKANISGLGIQESLTAGSGISIAAGTISATGLTTNNLASNAAITNGQLANSALTLGSTLLTLGSSVTTVAGLTSVTSTGFTGALTGNASTATKLVATKNINGVAFDGSADITVAANAGTLTGTTLASNVVTSSLTSVGTITSGTWSGTTIAIANGGTGATTKAAAFNALSPMTTAGDIVYGGASGTGTRLAAGSNGQVLTMVSGNPAWSNSGGSIVTMSATGNATSTASYIIFTGSTSGQTITIPSAVTLGAGRELTIKNVASVSVSIASLGGNLIQDNSTLLATTAALGIEPSNNWMKLVSDGTNWYIFRALF